MTNDMLFDSCRALNITEGPHGQDKAKEFWSTDEPIIDEANNRVIRGGMFEHQRDWYKLNNRIKALVTGLGGGKTMIGGKRIIALSLENAPAPSIAVSPTFPMARKTIIPTLQLLLEGKKSVLGRGFNWKYNKTFHEFRIWYHGREALIWVGTADDPLSLKGSNLGAAWLDEPFIQKHEAYQEVHSRVRHPDARRQEILLTGCVTRDTLVLPKHGLTPIGEMVPEGPTGYMWTDVELYGSHRKFHTATQTFNNALEQPTVKITTQSGFELEATEEHPVLVMGVNGRAVWKRADELTTQDFVAIGRGMNVWGDQDPLQDFNPTITARTKIKPSIEMTDDLAYFLGLWVAEGGLDKVCGKISICCGDREVIASLCLDGVNGIHFRSSKRRDQAATGSTVLRQMMEYIRMPLVKSPQRTFPHWVLRGRREWALHFLAGMYDGDGCIQKSKKGIQYTTTSKSLAQVLQLVLLNLGVVSSLHRVENGPSERVQKDTVVYHVFAVASDAVKLAKLLPLRIRRKLKRASEIVARGVLRDSSKVPHQNKLVLAAWAERSKLRWRNERIGWGAQSIADTSRRMDRLSYRAMSSFISMWEANEPDDHDHEALDALRQNIRDGYYWPRITKLEKSSAQTVDFVVPDTHSFWSNGFISHNTPENLNWGFDLCMGEMKETNDVGLVTANTRANRALVGYAERLEATYDPIIAKSYVGGQFVAMQKGTVYYKYAPIENQVVKQMPYGAELGVGMDFNVNPMAAALFWHHGPSNHMHFFHEIELPNSDTEYMCSVLKELFWIVDEDVAQKFKLLRGVGLREVFPDASGSSRATQAPGGRTDFHFIRQAGFDIKCRSINPGHYSNPEQKDRYNSVNAKFTERNGRVTLTVSPMCKRLSKYLLAYNHELKNKDEQKAMSHLLDAFSYPVAYLYMPSREILRSERLLGV